MKPKRFRSRLLFSALTVGLGLILLSCASPPKIITFEANPTTIRNPGDASTLTWNTKNATRAYISDIGEVRPSGSTKVKPLRTTTYNLTAANDNGKVTKRIDVLVIEPPPPPGPRDPGPQPSPLPKMPNIRSFFADPDEIARGSGQSSVLRWITENATEASISTLGKVSPVNEGSIKVSPGQTTRYLMTAKNTVGQVTQPETVDVVVIEPKIKKPDQKYPRHGEMLTDPKRKTKLEWERVIHTDSRLQAQSYNVEIDFFDCCAPGKWCSEVKGGKVIKISSIEKPYYEFEFNHPNFNKIKGEKKGRWRVRAVNKDGEVGEKTDWREFRYDR